MTVRWSEIIHQVPHYTGSFTELKTVQIHEFPNKELSSNNYKELTHTISRQTRTTIKFYFKKLTVKLISDEFPIIICNSKN